MDPFKADDCLPHDLLIAKREAEGFHLNDFCVMYSYLDCCRQKVKIDSLRSTAKKELKFGYHRDQYYVICSLTFLSVICFS